MSGHLFAVTPAEVQPVGELLITTVPRTVVDIAGAAPFDEGVMVADAALRSGVPREALEEALVVAGPRRAHLRIEHVVAFAHPGAESAAESGSRVLLLRMGIEPPVLQWAVRLTDGSVASVDFWFASVEVGGETDGDTKYLNTALAPDGAGPVLVKEKRREDDLRTRMRAMARWGWAQSRSLQLLRPILQRVGVVPATPRATLADYIAAARGARPRFIPRRPQVQR